MRQATVIPVLALTIVVLLAAFLRLYALGSLPLSPYWEEVAVAYDANSLLQTGKDHHGALLPLIALESFGDWKPVGYAYAQIPFIATIGLTTTALRLPAAFAGVALVILTGYVAAKMNHSFWTGVLASLLAAVSPWLILFSRGGWEVNVATALFWLGAVLLLHSVLPNLSSRSSTSAVNWSQQLGGSLLLWAAAYTYHALRVLVPLLFVCLGLFVLFTKLRQAKKISPTTVFGLCMHIVSRTFGIALIITLIALVPFVLSWGSPQLTQRFSETSIFADISIIEQSNQAIEQAGKTPMARLLYHRYSFFARTIAESYLSHFSPSFLFTKGDSNPRHATGFGGQLYLLDAVLVLAGLFALLTRRSAATQPWTWLVITIAIISPLPASTTHATPHALRTLPLAVSLLVIAALGMAQLITMSAAAMSNWRSLRPIARHAIFLVTAVLLGTYLLQPIAWWRHYTTVYSVEHSDEWQFGYEQLYKALAEAATTFDTMPIFVSRVYGRPAMYYWFFSQTPPREVQAANATARKDQGEFITFQRYTFIDTMEQVTTRPALLAARPDDISVAQKQQSTVIAEVPDPFGNIIWQILYLP